MLRFFISVVLYSLPGTFPPIPKKNVKMQFESSVDYFPMQKVLYFNNLFYINDLYMYMCLSRDKLGTKIGVKNAKKNKYRH